MSQAKKHLVFTVAIGLGLAAIVAVMIYLSVGFLVEFWWFSEIERSRVLLLRTFYRDIIGIVMTLLFVAIVYFNFWFVARMARTETSARDDASAARTTLARRLAFTVAGGSPRLFFPLSLAVSLPVLAPIYTHWEDFLLFLSRPRAGVSDPAFGKDLAFYLFDYPVYSVLQLELSITFALMLAIVYLLYRLTGTIAAQAGRRAAGARLHLSLLVMILIVIQAWSILLDRIELLYEDRHLPVFFGPGFVEMRYHLPLIWLTFLAFLILAGVVVRYFYTRRSVKWVAVSALVYMTLIGLRHLSLVPDLLERFYVAPNPVRAEHSFMQRNIDATLAAYGLDRVKRIDFPIESSLSAATTADVRETLHNVPVWDEAFLLDVYEQLQALRPYFTFVDIDVDRYRIGNALQQVNIGARELNLAKLPAEAQSWENRHLVYTHGLGVAMSPSDQQGGRPMQWYLSNLTMTSPVGLSVQRPQIYFGLERYDYAIVPNKAAAAGESANDSGRYSGRGGIPAAALFRRLVFAAYFGDPTLLFSMSLGRDSRLLMRRNIRERIRAIAPFLELDDDAYPVLLDGRIVWVQDAYTVSDRYPMSTPMAWPLERSGQAEDRPTRSINYIRNSVKVVVDAYDGTVDFYIVDAADPIARAYARVYPGLFTPLEHLPKALIPHLNYPQDLFDAQIAVYARYHRREPEVFYQQSERLQVAKRHPDAPDSYYLTLDLLESPDGRTIGSEKFVVMSPLAPVGRQNLRQILMAGCLGQGPCTDRYYGGLLAYDFPTDVQLEGPAQIEALSEQNPAITRQLTLWNQRGSKVLRGRMIIVPVDGSILYVQPLYLVAERAPKIPQLARVIVAMNHRVVMESSLEAAFARIREQLKGSREP